MYVYVSMCVSRNAVYACMFICKYVCIYVERHAGMSVCMYICMKTETYESLSVCKSTSVVHEFPYMFVDISHLYHCVFILLYTYTQHYCTHPSETDMCASI